MSKSPFNDEQREELRRVGLCKAQIEALEHAVPHIANLLTPDPTVTATRDHLARLLNNFDRLQEQISAIDGARERTVRDKVWHTLNVAACHLQKGDDVADILFPNIANYRNVVVLALQSLPKQTRSMPSNPMAVARIVEALESGYTSARAQGWKPQKVPFRQSPGTPFMRVVATVYRAAGHNTGAERAARAYARSRTTTNPDT